MIRMVPIKTVGNLPQGRARLDWDFDKILQMPLVRGTVACLPVVMFGIFFVASGTASATPVLQIQSPFVSIQSQDEKSSILLIAVGQLSGNRLWVNGEWVTLKSDDIPLPTFRYEAVPEVSATAPAGTGTGIGAGGQMPARFTLPVGTDGRCTESSRIRDLLYLLRSMSKAISVVEVAHGEDGKPCAENIQRQLTSYGLSALASLAAASPRQVSIRIHFAGAGETVTNAASPRDLSDPAAAAGSKTDASPRAKNEPLLVFLNNKPVTPGPDGWFVQQASEGKSVELEIRLGSEVIYHGPLEVLILKKGFNLGYKTDRYAGVTLEHGPTLAATLGDRTDKSIIGFEIDISVPVFLKFGIGYTALAPLPSEKERDRTTVVFAARSYPFWERYHIAGEAMASLKSGSRIPWTLLGTVLGGTDLIQFRGNWSVPVGAGFRLFQSEIKKGKGEENEGKPIRIPEAVLGPALQIGASYRSGLFYAEIAGSITPVFAAGAKPIVTFNPLFSSGYQISAIDIVTLNIMNQDIRYPSIEGEAKVISSSVVLGYQRDFL